MGGTGFVGSYICQTLINSGWHIRLLAHKHKPVLKNNNLTTIQGSVFQADSLTELLKGADYIVYNIGIIREYPEKDITFQKLHFEGLELVLKYAEMSGVKNLLYMSANGVDESKVSYQQTKIAAEQLLKGSDMNWIILRPSLVFGDPGSNPEFCSQMVEQIINPLFPAPNFFKLSGGSSQNPIEFTPIHVEDIALFIEKILADPEKWNRSYHLGGSTRISWHKMLKLLATVIQKKHKWIVPVPLLIVWLAAGLFDRFSWFPVTQDQLSMLAGGNVCSDSDFENTMERKPRKFNQSNLSYLAK